jgi:hypothetical protein
VAGWFSGHNAKVDGPPPPSVAADGQAKADPHAVDVRLITIEGPGDVQILAGNHRIIDVLNADEPVRLRSPLGAEAMVGNSWVEVDDEERDEILALIPPPRITDPKKRLHRLPQQVSVRVGPYVVTGHAHIPPGAEVTGFLLRHRPHFVPLTNATIREAGEPDVTVPISIVNLRAADAVSSAELDVPSALPAQPVVRGATTLHDGR